MLRLCALHLRNGYNILFAVRRRIPPALQPKRYPSQMISLDRPLEQLCGQTVRSSQVATAPIAFNSNHSLTLNFCRALASAEVSLYRIFLKFRGHPSSELFPAFAFIVSAISELADSSRNCGVDNWCSPRTMKTFSAPSSCAIRQDPLDDATIKKVETLHGVPCPWSSFWSVSTVSNVTRDCA